MTTHTLAEQAPIVTDEADATERRAAHKADEPLDDAALLGIILGTGAGSLAARLLDEHGGVGGLLRAGVGHLADHRGVGPVRAGRVAAAIELGRRAVAAASLEALPQLFDHTAVVSWAQPRLAILDHEELWVLVLDGRSGLRAARRAASGGLHGLHVGVRDVLRFALREAASAFILVHNHPSGDATPSTEDVTFTSAVATAATVVGTPLVDHVIIARQRSSSFLALGLIAAST